MNAIAVTQMDTQATRRRGIGPLGTTARVVVGGLLVARVTWGHLARGFHPSAWLLRRDDQVGCAVFWPVDRLERR